MPLTDEQVANILFNEMRSFSGDNIDQARVAMAHVIMNGDKTETEYGIPREVTADHRVANVPAVEQKTYDDGMKAVKPARYHKSKNTDITGGAYNLYYASRKNQFETSVYGDFRVCPLSKYRKGTMQDVCIDSGTNMVIEKLSETTNDEGKYEYKAYKLKEFRE